ncbi:uncharacterized protein LOC141594113 [Silene latifolia]|uniref:uncharacterized protein LOC141594113 n=1 Tax=Silene latifolia TaxID=37657 RepID=UPI003D7807FC
MGSTIFGRREPNNINNIELSILGGYLNIHCEGPFTLNTAYLTAQYFQTQGEKTTGTIVCGGIATFLAHSLFPALPRDLQYIDGDRYLSLASMTSQTWLTSDYRTSKIDSSLSVDLPCTTLPRLTPLRTVAQGVRPPPLPEYHLPILPPPALAASKKRRRHETEEGSTPSASGQPSTATPTPTPTSTPAPDQTQTQSVLPANFVPPPPFEASSVMDLGCRDGLLLEIAERQARMERDLALTLFPLYEDHMRRHCPIPEGWPHPSFYRYPAEGYPESASEEEEEDEDPAAAATRAQEEQRRRREQEEDPDYTVTVEDVRDDEADE